MELGSPQAIMPRSKIADINQRMDRVFVVFIMASSYHVENLSALAAR
jgi:hypothetical protein